MLSKCLTLKECWKHVTNTLKYYMQVIAALQACKMLKKNTRTNFDSDFNVWNLLKTVNEIKTTTSTMCLLC